MLIYPRDILRECDKSKEAKARAIDTRASRLAFSDLMIPELKFGITEKGELLNYQIYPNGGDIGRNVLSDFEIK